MESYCDHSSLMERCTKVVMCLFSSSSDSELIICLLRLACRLLQVLAPLPIGFAVFMVHLATIPITGTGINPARSFGAQVIYNHNWHHHVSTQFSFSLIIPDHLEIPCSAFSDQQSRVHYAWFLYISSCQIHSMMIDTQNVIDIPGIHNWGISPGQRVLGVRFSCSQYYGIS